MHSGARCCFQVQPALHSALLRYGELPSGRETETVAPVATPVVVDAETLAVEVADADTETNRDEARGADVRGAEEVDVPHRLVRRDTPHRLGRVRHQLETGEQGLLLLPVLAVGAGNRFLAERDPPHLGLVVANERLLLLRVPAAGLRVEVGGVEVADVEERQRAVRTGQQDEVVVPQPLEVFA